jgi:polar amino acid transport system permease protein
MMPAFINAFTELLKHTTLLAGIGVTELTYQAYTLGSQTFKQLEFLTAIAVLYFAAIFPLSTLARVAEFRVQRRMAN